MQKHIEEYCPITSYDLDVSQYTLSLIQESYAKELYGATQIEAIQLNLMSLLGEQILRFTNGDSSSVKNEDAKMVFQSILYCCDLYLVSLPSIKRAVDCLEDLNQTHSNGLKLIQEYLLQTKELLAKIKQSKLQLHNIAYQETIEHGFDEFIKKYDARFDAQNTFANIDYPLLFDDTNQSGIVYIKNYLEKLQLENEFCSLFSLEDINCFLASYGARYRLNSNELLENITELLLRNLLGGALLGKREISLFLTREDCEILQNELHGLTENQCKESTEIALSVLLNRLKVSDAIKEYLTSYTDIFSSLLSHSVSNHELQNFILV